MLDIKSLTTIRDALHNLHPNTKSEPEYAKGVFVGVVAGLIGMTGCSYAEAMEAVICHLPHKVMKEAVPESWVEDIKSNQIEII